VAKKDPRTFKSWGLVFLKLFKIILF